MQKYFVFLAAFLTGSVWCGKLKLVAFKGPLGGFAGVKYRSPKLLGLKHHGFGGFGGGFGGGFHAGGGYHEQHHEYHESYHSSGGGFGGGYGGWLGK